MKLATAIRIENWCVAPGHSSIYEAPERHGFVLHGEVYGHPGHADGKRIRTSAIDGFRDGLLVMKSGRRYELGEPNADYERLFSGARARVLASLKGGDK